MSVCIIAMISDLHLFDGMAGMRIVSRVEKSCVSNRTGRYLRQRVR